MVSFVIAYLFLSLLFSIFSFASLCLFNTFFDGSSVKCPFSCSIYNSSHSAIFVVACGITRYENKIFEALVFSFSPLGVLFVAFY